MLWGLNEFMHMNQLYQCLPYTKHLRNNLIALLRILWIAPQVYHPLTLLVSLRIWFFLPFLPTSFPYLPYFSEWQIAFYLQGLLHYHFCCEAFLDFPLCVIYMPDWMRSTFSELLDIFLLWPFFCFVDFAFLLVWD